MHSYSAGSIGQAVNQLKLKKSQNESGIKTRFDALATAKTTRNIVYHARGIIQLLKQAEVKLDYPRFAQDLYNLQFGYENQKRIQRQWGKDFYNDNIDSNENRKDEHVS
jgi:CRISPR system Cascade subunit CasB